MERGIRVIGQSWLVGTPQPATRAAFLLFCFCGVPTFPARRQSLTDYDYEFESFTNGRPLGLP